MGLNSYTILPVISSYLMSIKVNIKYRKILYSEMQNFFPLLFCLSAPTSFTKYNNTITYKDDNPNNTVYPSRTYSYLKRESSVDEWPSLKVSLLMWAVIIYILLSLEWSCNRFQVIHEVKYSSTWQPSINNCCHLASYLTIFGETLPVFSTSTVISIR